MADNGKSFKLKIIAPQRIFYEGEADMIELRTTEGEIGILKDHIPLTAVLSPGVLTIKAEGTEKKAALHTGFIEIQKDNVIILSESCEWPDEIDMNRAMEAKIRAERRLKTTDSEMNVTRAETALLKSRIRIELAEKTNK